MKSIRFRIPVFINTKKKSLSAVVIEAGEKLYSVVADDATVVDFSVYQACDRDLCRVVGTDVEVHEGR